VTEHAQEATRLRDGSAIVIRPIEPDDAPRLREVWDGMSELTRRRRFLAPANEVSDEDVRYLVEVDHRRHEALLALDEDGRGIAVARYVRAPRDRTTAELAVVVADDWHRRGVATALLDRLSERARENGIEHFSAIVSEDNDVVLSALERAGAERAGVTDEGEVELAVAVPTGDLGERLSGLLRAAAEGQRDFVSAGLRRLAVWRRRG
jgi:RimJ/RimL family protein N-acetyltransferase